MFFVTDVGESERSLQQRFSEHKGYVINSHLNKATGEHFNLKGHNVSDMRVIIIEKFFLSKTRSQKRKRVPLYKADEHKVQGLKQENLKLLIAM